MSRPLECVLLLPQAAPVMKVVVMMDGRAWTSSSPSAPFSYCRCMRQFRCGHYCRCRGPRLRTIPGSAAWPVLCSMGPDGERPVVGKAAHWWMADGVQGCPRVSCYCRSWAAGASVGQMRIVIEKSRVR